jgi:drug/metabolite transporter (DMT)-like permease
MTLTLDLPARVSILDLPLRSVLRRCILPALVLSLANAWALQYMLAKSMGTAGMSPFTSLTFVHVVMVLVFGAVLLWKGEAFGFTLGRITFFAYVAALGNVLSLGAELIAAPHISAGLLSIIAAMAPVFTVLFSLLLGSERINSRNVMGLIAGLCASATILYPELTYNADGVSWILFAFLAPVSFGAMAVITCKFWPRGLNTTQVAFGNSLAGLFLLVPYMLIEDAPLLPPDNSYFGAILLAGFSAALLAEFWLFAKITRMGGAIYASCADFGAIAFGLFWAALLFREVPTWWMTAAGIFAMFSMLVMRKSEAK